MLFRELNNVASRVRGTKVHYTDPGTGKISNGIVKSYPDPPIIEDETDPEYYKRDYDSIDHVFVAYAWRSDQWDQWESLTGQRTRLQDLNLGWVKKLDFRLKEDRQLKLGV